MTGRDFQHHLSAFLARYLPGEVGLSANTIRSYRDTFTLLLRYCQAHENIAPGPHAMRTADRRGCRTLPCMAGD